MSRLKKGMVFLLVLVLALRADFVPVSAADMQYRMNVEVYVDGVLKGSVAALDDNYENHLYLSLKGLSAVLEGTQKAFSPAVESRSIQITTGSEGWLPLSPWSERELSFVGSATSSRNEISLDGKARRYYSFILSRNGGYDAFLTPVSLAMLFDLAMEVDEGKIEIRTGEPFYVSAQEMEKSGYLQGVNSLVVGDATSGERFYQYREETAFAIASTTKLMTYLIFMDAVSQGKCSLEDAVEISGKADALSKGPDGLISLSAGRKIPARELLLGMLLPSSNECALALAEHAAGSEEAFVALMNEKAREFGWVNAEFYNCHGLPCFEDQLVPAKRQNHMSAGEMFELASAIMNTYPQITEITSTMYCRLDTLGLNVRNTNAVLYNLENTVGLKTGTTNKAGDCLVTCVREEKAGETHYLITVLLGAEGDENRGIVSEIAARYAVATLNGYGEGAQNDPHGQGGADEGIPEEPETVIRELIRRLSFYVQK